MELKNPNTNTKAEIIDKYCEKLNLKLNKTQIQQLTEFSLSYNQLINNLDLISLSSDYNLALQNVLIIPKPLLFTQSFRLGNLDKDISKWQDLGVDDLQLGLSLVFGKLEKQISSESEYLQRKLIQTDQKIKTQSKITPSTWWKLFLWQAKQIMQEP